jgi:hypothetical protein
LRTGVRIKDQSDNYRYQGDTAYEKASEAEKSEKGSTRRFRSLRIAALTASFAEENCRLRDRLGLRRHSRLRLR